MPTVFSRAVLFALALLAATACLGLWIGDLHGQLEPAILRWGTVHRLSGVLAALMTVLVNSMSVTYFIGTGRWCREVVETYRLDGGLYERSRMIKRKAFPWAMMGMLAVVTIVALGGAADPASGRPGTQDWVNAHLVASLALIGLIGLCFQGQLARIRDQQQLIEEVLARVHDARVSRGLEA